jgi:hypothetical protein
MKKIVVFAVVYLLSAFASYKWVQAAYSKGGIFEILDPKGGAVLITVFPVYNTVSAIYLWVFEPPYADRNFNRFFNIKTTNNETPTQQ